VIKNAQPRASHGLVEGDGWRMEHGDCLHLLRSLADNSVDAIVTDPPAGIGFMDKDWDSDKGGRDAWIAWLAEIMGECLRVLKPGGRLVSWALPRTSHWTGESIETSGLEICDVHHHIFGTGFPKSLNVSSVMHELLGVTDGEYGTALKPAVEHWILARKPLKGTYAENIRRYGTGALNIGGCRNGSGDDIASAGGTKRSGGIMGASTSLGGWKPKPDTGRWPAHLSLDEYAAALLNEMSGECPSAGSTAAKADRKTEDRRGFEMQQGRLYPERTGGASRFFYVAKGSRAEKDAGLEHLSRKSGGEATGRKDGSKGTKNPRAGSGRTGGVRNTHPTVKSIELMRWLVRLVAPMPGSLVVDPFAGSGTTGLGCLAEGMRFVGFEIGPDYFDIACARLDAGTRQQALPLAAPVRKTEEPLQVDLFAGDGAA
jgi:DNA modification methylase